MSPSKTPARKRAPRVLAAVLIAGWLSACRQAPDSQTVTPTADSTLRIGFGLSTGQNAQAGISQAAGILTSEGLLAIDRTGRPQPWLADHWSLSPDGLILTIHLRAHAMFHDGDRVTSAAVRDALQQGLPNYIGAAIEDLKEIRTVSETQLDLVLTQPSQFILESLDLPIRKPGSNLIGTGPYKLSSPADTDVVLVANADYYGGKPLIDTIRIQPYDTVRAAWAELLRGNVDMLYEVGSDALDSLRPSQNVRVFSYQRSYTYLVIFNFRRPALRDPKLRRALNSAINREEFLRVAMKNRGSVADGPIRPSHWAYDPSIPKFEYEPHSIQPTSLTLLLTDDRSQEPLALELQRQLSEIGVQLKFEVVTLDKWFERTANGDFDLLFADAINGPSLLRPYRLWHSTGVSNVGKYSNPQVDKALDRLRHASNDSDYKSAAADFQRAIVEDPPAIFLAWSERARAVSTRFDVPVEPGRDILSTLRLWRPVPDDARSRPGTD